MTFNYSTQFLQNLQSMLTVNVNRSIGIQPFYQLHRCFLAVRLTPLLLRAGLSDPAV